VKKCSASSGGYQCVGVPTDNPTKVELVPSCQTCGCPGNKNCSDGTCVQRSDIPESFNWADKGVITPIRDQGYCGSCWDFAGVAAVEAMYNIEHKTTGGSIDLSEQELLSCGNVGSCDGGGIESGLSYIQQKGIGTESCFPYQMNDSAACIECPTRHGFSAFRNVNTELFRFVMENGPIPITIDVGEPYMHAVLMIGWSKEGDIYIKNSWGGGENQFYAPISYLNFKGPSYQPTGTY
jgi:C1A family cysteine protease